jgi:anti-sigma B factor antagonist
MKNILLKRKNTFYKNTIIVPSLKKSIIKFRVRYFSTPSIGVLVAIAAPVRQKGGYFRVYGLTDRIKRTFDLVDASKVLEIYDSEYKGESENGTV